MTRSQPVPIMTDLCERVIELYSHGTTDPTRNRETL
jgi:hypothetical protein